MKLAGLLLVCAATACGTTHSATPHLRTDSVPASSLADYKTFAFGLPSQSVAPFEPSARSSELDQRLRPLLAAELESEGYRETTRGDRANFVVVVASSDAVQDGVPEAQAEATPPVVKGIVVVDAFNSSNDVRVWRKVAESEVDLQTTDDELLRAVVRRMMVSFPDRNVRRSIGAP